MFGFLSPDLLETQLLLFCWWEHFSAAVPSAPVTAGCSSPRCAQGAGGRSHPRRTPLSGCVRTEPAPTGEQLGSLHPLPAAPAGGKAVRLRVGAVVRARKPGEQMGITSHSGSWLGSCPPAWQSPWPVAAPES